MWFFACWIFCNILGIWFYSNPYLALTLLWWSLIKLTQDNYSLCDALWHNLICSSSLTTESRKNKPKCQIALTKQLKYMDAFFILCFLQWLVCTYTASTLHSLKKSLSIIKERQIRNWDLNNLFAKHPVPILFWFWAFYSLATVSHNITPRSKTRSSLYSMHTDLHECIKAMFSNAFWKVLQYLLFFQMQPLK